MLVNVVVFPDPEFCEGTAGEGYKCCKYFNEEDNPIIINRCGLADIFNSTVPVPITPTLKYCKSVECKKAYQHDLEVKEFAENYEKSKTDPVSTKILTHGQGVSE